MQLNIVVYFIGVIIAIIIIQGDTSTHNHYNNQDHPHNDHQVSNGKSQGKNSSSPFGRITYGPSGKINKTSAGSKGWFLMFNAKNKTTVKNSTSKSGKISRGNFIASRFNTTTRGKSNNKTSSLFTTKKPLFLTKNDSSSISSFNSIKNGKSNNKTNPGFTTKKPWVSAVDATGSNKYNNTHKSDYTTKKPKEISFNTTHSRPNNYIPPQASAPPMEIDYNPSAPSMEDNWHNKLPKPSAPITETTVHQQHQNPGKHAPSIGWNPDLIKPSISQHPSQPFPPPSQSYPIPPKNNPSISYPPQHHPSQSYPPPQSYPISPKNNPSVSYPPQQQSPPPYQPPTQHNNSQSYPVLPPLQHSYPPYPPPQHYPSSSQQHYPSENQYYPPNSQYPPNYVSTPNKHNPQEPPMHYPPPKQLHEITTDKSSWIFSYETRRTTRRPFKSKTTTPAPNVTTTKPSKNYPAETQYNPAYFHPSLSQYHPEWYSSGSVEQNLLKPYQYSPNLFYGPLTYIDNQPRPLYSYRHKSASKSFFGFLVGVMAAKMFMHSRDERYINATYEIKRYRRKEHVLDHRNLAAHELRACGENVTLLCAENSFPICARNGTIMCVTNITKTKPCDDPKNVCYVSQINCTALGDDFNWKQYNMACTLRNFTVVNQNLTSSNQTLKIPDFTNSSSTDNFLSQEIRYNNNNLQIRNSTNFTIKAYNITSLDVPCVTNLTIFGNSTVLRSLNLTDVSHKFPVLGVDNTTHVHNVTFCVSIWAVPMPLDFDANKEEQSVAGIGNPVVQHITWGFLGRLANHIWTG